MNLKRQYKLYRLGVDIPPSQLKIIKFVEDIFTRLVLFKNDDSNLLDYYVDTTEGKIYFADQKDGYMRIRWKGFWKDLKKIDEEVCGLIRIMFKINFNIVNVDKIIFLHSFGNFQDNWDNYKKVIEQHYTTTFTTIRGKQCDMVNNVGGINYEHN